MANSSEAFEFSGGLEAATDADLKFSLGAKVMFDLPMDRLLGKELVRVQIAGMGVCVECKDAPAIAFVPGIDTGDPDESIRMIVFVWEGGLPAQIQAAAKELFTDIPQEEGRDPGTILYGQIVTGGFKLKTKPYGFALELGVNYNLTVNADGVFCYKRTTPLRVC